MMPELGRRREAMPSSQVYNDLTPELIEARARAVTLADDYNRSFGQAAEERQTNLRAESASTPRSTNRRRTTRGRCLQCQTYGHRQPHLARWGEHINQGVT
jgi:hypothetical protein